MAASLRNFLSSGGERWELIGGRETKDSRPRGLQQITSNNQLTLTARKRDREKFQGEQGEAQISNIFLSNIFLFSFFPFFNLSLHSSIALLSMEFSLKLLSQASKKNLIVHSWRIKNPPPPLSLLLPSKNQGEGVTILTKNRFQIRSSNS